MQVLHNSNNYMCLCSSMNDKNVTINTGIPADWENIGVSCREIYEVFDGLNFKNDWTKIFQKGS